MRAARRWAGERAAKKKILAKKEISFMAMDLSELNILLEPRARELVERHLADDPTELALRLGNPAVTRLIKVLQKCRSKLPSYYDARCVVTQVGYEQSSSEATAFARFKELEGGLAVDLTCGLGVDTLALSRRFDKVYTVEIDPVKAETARRNFELLGARNIEVICAPAEDFIREWDRGPLKGLKADLVFCDPSRQKEDGKRVYSLEESSPAILDIWDRILARSGAAMVKLSPMFDVDEAFRLFGDSVGVEVISVNDECKEVIVKTGFPGSAQVTAIRGGEIESFAFDRRAPKETFGPPAENYNYLLVPDVGFYKSRTVADYLMQVYGDHMADIRLQGYVFSKTPLDGFAGKTYKIVASYPYQPKKLAKIFRSEGIFRADVHQRDFPMPAQRIQEALRLKPGGDTDIFCTLYDREPTVFRIERVPEY